MDDLILFGIRVKVSCDTLLAVFRKTIHFAPSQDFHVQIGFVKCDSF